MDVSTILNAIKQVGSATPAFVSLFNHVLPSFSSNDQAKLKSALEEARAGSDAAEADFVNASRGK